VSSPPLLPHERGGRVAVVVALLVCGILLWRWAPALSAFAPKCVFHSVTGLPCAFCGATRSVCAVVGGEWGRALELNAVGVGVVALFLLTGLVAGIEAMRGKALLDWKTAWHRSVRFLPLLLVVLTVWWGVRLMDAVRTPKGELVDLSNPVAKRVVDWLGGGLPGKQRAERD